MPLYHLGRASERILAAAVREKKKLRPRSKLMVILFFFGLRQNNNHQKPKPDVRCQMGMGSQQTTSWSSKVAVEEPARYTYEDGSIQVNPDTSELVSLSPGASAE